VSIDVAADFLLGDSVKELLELFAPVEVALPGEEEVFLLGDGVVLASTSAPVAAVLVAVAGVFLCGEGADLVWMAAVDVAEETVGDFLAGEAEAALVVHSRAGVALEGEAEDFLEDIFTTTLSDGG
jgi:hypothetical protein